ncbi:MAG: haloacid dehalogenase-like hydrolase [Deltaproteobacteria bacterium]|nr:MAG: haloacid dehalogenase-like hydrolase [Deltaproteobacteria bacterium]
MLPPPLPQQVDVLEVILERIPMMREEGGQPVVVFDLDGTLYDSRPRTLAVLAEYADEVRADYPDVSECLDQLDIGRLHYLISNTLREVGLTHVDVVRDITGFWRERFYSDDYLRHDVPTDGAPEFVTACYESGAGVLYLGGRDIPSMLLGTVSSLRDHGFPIGVVGVQLVLKPDATLGDEAFKRSAIPTLGRIGETLAFFDNEPANCNIAHQHFPDAYVALLETQQVPGAPDPDETLHHIVDFRVG